MKRPRPRFLSALAVVGGGAAVACGGGESFDSMTGCCFTQGNAGVYRTVPCDEDGPHADACCREDSGADVCDTADDDSSTP